MNPTLLDWFYTVLRRTVQDHQNWMGYDGDGLLIRVPDPLLAEAMAAMMEYERDARTTIPNVPPEDERALAHARQLMQVYRVQN